MMQDLGVPPLENPMECFCEEVEQEGCCSKAEGEEKIYIELSVPFEYQEDMIVHAYWDVTKGRFEVAFHHDSATSQFCHFLECCFERFILQFTLDWMDPVIDRSALWARQVEDAS